MDSKQSSFFDSLDYVIDRDGNKHYVLPMMMCKYQEVNKLFGKIDEVYIINNLPMPLLDKKGKVVMKNGEVVIDTERYDAMWEILEMAFNDTKENIEKWIDIKQVEDVLPMFRRISGLKKKIAEMENKMNQLTGTESLQDLFKTLPLP